MKTILSKILVCSIKSAREHIEKSVCKQIVCILRDYTVHRVKLTSSCSIIAKREMTIT